MKTLMLLMMLMAFPLSALAADSSVGDKTSDSNEYVENIVMKERQGIRDYKKANYEKAYTALSYAAKRGFKQSQYLLGLMYLKGQYVKQSLFYGMAWLGVAKESKAKDWLALFDRIYAASTEQQQQAIDTNRLNFIQKYGLKSQNMSCNLQARLGGRKKTLQCSKKGKVFDIPRTPVNNSLY